MLKNNKAKFDLKNVEKNTKLEKYKNDKNDKSDKCWKKMTSLRKKMTTCHFTCQLINDKKMSIYFIVPDFQYRKTIASVF